MRRQSVAFDKIDVCTTPGARDELAALTCGSVVVPVFVEDGDVDVGFGGG
jgi:hypothetical protein